MVGPSDVQKLSYNHQTQPSNPMFLPLRDSVPIYSGTAGLIVVVGTVSAIGIRHVSTAFTLCVPSQM